MDAPLHKVVNGRRIKLSSKEKAEWLGAGKPIRATGDPLVYFIETPEETEAREAARKSAQQEIIIVTPEEKLSRFIEANPDVKKFLRGLVS